MLTGWLTLTAILVGSANPGNAASSWGPLTFPPSCRVKGHPEAELTLNCGDGKRAGVVQYWHTPFGELQEPGFHAGLEPVFMRHDGSLVIPNSSNLHSGLYYCLLQHTDGAALWQYELHVGPNDQNHKEYGQANRCAALRVRRNAGPAEERQPGVSDGLFAGAVAASVLLTFVVGFSAGALSRTHVLRCLGAVTMRLQSLKRRTRQADTPDHSSQMTITMSPTHTNQAFETEEVGNDDSASYATAETTALPILTTPSPPAKPKRSFRHKREEEEEAAAYLERCDYMKEERNEREDVAQRGQEDMREGGNEERKKEDERETSGFYLLEDEGSRTETHEDKRSEEREERIDRSLEAAGEQQIRNKDGGDEVRRDVEDSELKMEVKDKEISGELEESSTETEEEEEEEKKSSKNEDTSNNISEEPPSPNPRQGRRSRVIRLYQYDEDGQRFCHLPAPTPEAPGPAPRYKQRSLSLTRLSAIMAAASAGPLDRKETGGEESKERPHFHMEI
ncbi:uncharacterized protein [Leuresthes tenuis]|uniref:uncharacterized protein n=1 Tax=Leuresthes tenuis TaxID=355514 RepID=UPI003B50BE8F